MTVKHLLRGFWVSALALSISFFASNSGSAQAPAAPELPSAATGGDASPTPSTPADSGAPSSSDAAPATPSASADSGASVDSPAATPEAQPSTTPTSEPKLADPSVSADAKADVSADTSAGSAQAAGKAEGESTDTDASIKAEGQADVDADRRDTDRQTDRNVNRDRNADLDRADDRRDAQRRTSNYRPERPGQEDMDDQDADDRRDRDDRNRDYADRDDRDRDYSDRNRDRNYSNRDRDRDDTDFGVFFSTGGRGLAIDRIDRWSPFYRAGVRRGDTIVSLNGHRITRDADFHRWVYGAPDERAVLVVLRDGREVTYYVEPQWLAQTESRVAYDSDTAYETRGEAYLGVTLDERYQDGAYVQDVRDDSPADRAGLQRGDEILSLNGRAVRSPDHLTQIVSQMRPGDRVDIEFSRGRDRSVTVELGERQSTRVYSDSDVRYSDDRAYSNDGDVRYRDNRGYDADYRGGVTIDGDDVRIEGREYRRDNDVPARRPLGRVLRPFRD